MMFITDVNCSRWLKIKYSWIIIFLLLIAIVLAALASTAFFFKEEIEAFLKGNKPKVNKSKNSSLQKEI
jgi:hypothetical protein